MAFLQRNFSGHGRLRTLLTQENIADQLLTLPLETVYKIIGKILHDYCVSRYVVFVKLIKKCMGP
jgi:hypothetical protein